MSSTATPRRRDEVEMADVDALMRTIDRYGWALRYIERDDDLHSIAYTVGLHRYGLSELVVAGLSPDRSWPVLNDVAGRSTTTDNPVRPGALLTDVAAPFAVRVALRGDTSDLPAAHAVATGRRMVRALELVPVPHG